VKLWIFGAGAALLPLLTPTQQVLTLDDSIRIAEQNAFSLRTAASNVEKARQRTRQAWGALGPQVSANGSYSHVVEHSSLGGSSASLTTGGGGTTSTTGGTTGATTGGTSGTTAGTSAGGASSFSSGLNTQQASISLSLPIDISGTTRKNIRSTQFSYVASQDNLAAADNDLRLTVKNAYFQVLQAKAQIAVAQESVTNAQARLTNAQQKLAAGTLARIDVLQFEVQLSQAQADLIAAQNSLALGKENFNNVLGRSIDTDFDLADITQLPTNSTPTNELVRSAVENRPEIHASRANIQALRYLREATEAGMLPGLAVGATHFQLFDPGTVNSQFHQTQAFLNLNLPIFDSGITRARVRQARQDEAQAQIAYEQLQLTVSLEVQQALSNLTNSRALLDVAQAQVTQASEAYRLAIVRFNAGEGTTLDVTNAQTQLTQAQNGLVNARYNYLRAYAALQRSIAADASNGPVVAAPTGSRPTVPVPTGVTPAVPVPNGTNLVVPKSQGSK
jgi:outer membrane protein